MNNRLPQGWVSVSVGEVVVDLKYGTAKKCGHDSRGVPVLRIPNVANGVIDHTGLKYAELPRAEREKLGLIPGDVLIIRSNGSVSLVGRSAVVRNTERGFAFAGYLIRIRPSEAILPVFLSNSLGSYDTRQRIEIEARSTSGVNNINAEEIRSLPLSLPPLAEQRRIVIALEQALAKWEMCDKRLSRIPAILRRFRQAVLAAACDGRLTAGWRSKHLYEETGIQLISRLAIERRRSWQKHRRSRAYVEPLTSRDEDSLGDLPKGWGSASAEQCTVWITDGEHATPERTATGVYLLSARNVLDGVISLEKVDYISEREYARLSRRLTVHAGDVLLSCSGSVGRSCVVREGLRFALVRSVAVLRPMFDMGEYLSLALRSSQLQTQINEKKTATAQENIFQGKISSLMLPIPPLSEQREIVRQVTALFTLADRLEARCAKAKSQVEKLTRSILAKAFRGELVPTEAELARRDGRSYETAEQLLTRIKGAQLRQVAKARLPVSTKRA